MKTVSFRNDGVLDTRAISTFGVNVKKSDNAIGYFGTGLKYAIAIILREGCGITIHADKCYIFEKRDEVVRGKTFQFIYMNGEPLGFTTELGKNWKMWQAFRELYCNTLDEDGFVTDKNLRAAKDKTTIVVTGQQFYDVYLTRDKIILQTKPIFEHALCDIHPGNNSVIYYRGVRIYDGMGAGLFTYNIKSKINISEDRTAMYEFQLKNNMAKAIISCADDELCRKLILAPDNYLEHEINYDANGPSENFLRVARELRLNPKANPSLTEFLIQNGGIPALKDADLDEVQTVMLDRAIDFCGRIGYPVQAYKIIVSPKLRGGVMGLAENKKIHLSLDAFGMGTKYVASTLIEEYLHILTGHQDCTRELQNYLFNDIVSLGERLIGVPV